MTIETHILYKRADCGFSGFTVEVSHRARPNQAHPTSPCTDRCPAWQHRSPRGDRGVPAGNARHDLPTLTCTGFVRTAACFEQNGSPDTSGGNRSGLHIRKRSYLWLLKPLPSFRVFLARPGRFCAPRGASSTRCSHAAATGRARPVLKSRRPSDPRTGC